MPTIHSLSSQYLPSSVRSWPHFDATLHHADDGLSILTTHFAEHWPLYAGVSAFFVFYIFYIFALRPRYFSPIRNYPGPGMGHFFLGHMSAMVNEEPGRAMVRWHKEHGPVVKFIGPLPGRESISFLNYRALKTVLVDRPYEFPKPPYVRHVLGIAAGYGLLTLEGPEHQALRRFMNSAFAFKYLHEQFDTYYKPIRSFVEILTEKAKGSSPSNEEKSDDQGQVVEMTKLIDSCLMDIICLTAFGYECDSLHNPNQPLAKSYHTLVNLQSGGHMVFLMAILALPGGAQLAKWAVKTGWIGPTILKFNKLTAGILSPVLHPMGIFVDNIHQVNLISSQLLNEKMTEAQELKKAGNFSMDGGKIDVLSLLVRASLDDESPYKMNSDMLQHQMLTFLGAGHETTASGACWALWELATHPEVQTKLRKECQELIARNSTPGYQEIKHLRYLDAVVQETMRCRPPTPHTARQAAKDSTVDGVFVPKGTGIYIGNRCVNFDPSIWGEDAEDFKPERWENLPEAYNAQFSVLTFIAGPHHCIGRNMAILELKALLCSLIAYFDFAPAMDTPREKSAITMKPEGGLLLRVKRLNPADSLAQ